MFDCHFHTSSNQIKFRTKKNGQNAEFVHVIAIDTYLFSMWPDLFQIEQLFKKHENVLIMCFLKWNSIIRTSYNTQVTLK